MKNKLTWKMQNNTTSIVTTSYDPYNHTSPLSLNTRKIIGVYFIILFFVAVISNSLLLWIFFKGKKSLRSYNLINSVLTMVCLVSSFLDFPFLIPNTFNFE